MNYFLKLFTLAMFCFGSLIYGQDPDEAVLHVGTFTNEGAEGIYICSFNNLTGDVSLKGVASGMDNPNYLVKTRDGKLMYACMRPENNTEHHSVGAFKVLPDGNLEFINEMSSGGTDPCYVDYQKGIVALSNYGNGTLSFYKTASNGSLEKAYQIIQHEGSGPDRARQSGPHAHSVRFSPFSNRVYAADLGTDKLMIYDISPENGTLTGSQSSFVNLPPGSGPRHFDFHPTGRFIYVVNELNSSVSVLNEKNEVIQNIKTLPEDFEGSSYCADIHISSSGKFLYCSNRGHNSITTFKVDRRGKLTRLACTSTEGNWPRNFTFSPRGNFMLVANQYSNNITVFTLDQNSGIPRFTGKELNIPTPVCLVF